LGEAAVRIGVPDRSASVLLSARLLYPRTPRRQPVV